MKTCLFLLATALFVTSFCEAQLAGSAPARFHQAEPASDQETLNALLNASAPAEVLRPDDVVQVKIFNVKELDRDQRISTTGELSLPLVGKLTAEGLTAQQLEEAVAAKLAHNGMILKPQVSVSILSQPSAIVTVSGHVAKPGIFPAQGNLSILDYLSEAGAFNQNTANDAPASVVVTLIRPSLPAPVQIPLGPDPRRSSYTCIRLFAGDKVLVGEVGKIYAVGAFKNQGGYLLKGASPTSLTELVAQAGGVGYEADLGDAHLLRTYGEQRMIEPVNVAGILKGTDPDVVLRDDDILFVPSNKLKAAIKGGGSGIIVSLASALLYTR